VGSARQREKREGKGKWSGPAEVNGPEEGADRARAGSGWAEKGEGKGFEEGFVSFLKTLFKLKFF
jgi:hypothetical protein